MKTRPIAVSALIWFLIWLGVTLGIVMTGAVIGMILFPIFGPLFVDDMNALELLVQGAKQISFLALVWAPGLSIVACFMYAAKLRKQSNDAQNEPSGPA